MWAHPHLGQDSPRRRPSFRYIHPSVTMASSYRAGGQKKIPLTVWG
ncbi:hypothetical protein PBI_NEBKISS_108 [Mycobacterium phage Nebkiss]|nr:hypothetical protein PBI_NEBKISS_108 [Mycobacterium phage Nebkiss]